MSSEQVSMNGEVSKAKTIFHYVGLLVFAICAILGGIISNIGLLVGISIFVGLGLPVGILFVGWQQKRQFFCRKCKKHLVIGEDISYEECGHRVKRFTPNEKTKSSDTEYLELFNIRFHAKCQNCGAEHEFTCEYPGRETHFDGSFVDHDAEEMIRRNVAEKQLSQRVWLPLLAILAGIVLAFMGFIVRPADDSFDGLLKSTSDPRDYYGEYSTVYNDSLIFNLSVDSYGYNLSVTDVLKDTVTYGKSDVCYYKTASEIADQIQNPKYTDRDALLLVTGGGKGEETVNYILAYIKKDSSGKYTFSISGIGGENVAVTLTEGELEREDVMKDPEDLYGSYYAEDTSNSSLLRIDIGENSFAVHRTLFGKETCLLSAASYVYASAALIRENFENYADAEKDAVLVCRDNGYLFYWIEESDENGYVLRSDSFDCLFTGEEIAEADLRCDPKDYYGTYYSVDATNYKIHRLTISATGYVYETETVKESNSTSGEYSYLNSGVLCNLNNADKYSDKNALWINDRVLAWLIGTDANGTVIEYNGLIYTQEEVTLGEVMGDPEDYYGVYLYGTHSITLSDNGKATLYLNGNTEVYDYYYAPGAFISKLFGGTYGNGIVIYNERGSRIAEFSGDNLVHSNVTFVRQ